MLPPGPHGVSSEVCVGITVDRITIPRWVNSFRDGSKTRKVDTSTGERSVKLVADGFEKDCHATYGKRFRATGVPATSVFRILTNDLKKRKIFFAMGSSLLDC